MGEPKICVVAFTGPKINNVYDKMHEKKWEVSYTAKPVGFHFCLTAANIGNISNDKFINDLKDHSIVIWSNVKYRHRFSQDGSE